MVHSFVHSSLINNNKIIVKWNPFIYREQVLHIVLVVALKTSDPRSQIVQMFNDTFVEKYIIEILGPIHISGFRWQKRSSQGNFTATTTMAESKTVDQNCYTKIRNSLEINNLSINDLHSKQSESVGL